MTYRCWAPVYHSHSTIWSGPSRWEDNLWVPVNQLWSVVGEKHFWVHHQGYAQSIIYIPWRCPIKKFWIFHFQQDDNNWPHPNFLQFLTVPTVTNDECRSRHTPPLSNYVVNETLCTSSPSGKGICNRDAGGPLTLRGQLIGVVSWNRRCARGVPDGYTRISSYLFWIQSVSGVIPVWIFLSHLLG